MVSLNEKGQAGRAGGWESLRLKLIAGDGDSLLFSGAGSAFCLAQSPFAKLAKFAFGIVCFRGSPPMLQPV